MSLQQHEFKVTIETVKEAYQFDKLLFLSIWYADDIHCVVLAFTIHNKGSLFSEPKKIDFN